MVLFFPDLSISFLPELIFSFSTLFPVATFALACTNLPIAPKYNEVDSKTEAVPIANFRIPKCGTCRASCCNLFCKLFLEIPILISPKIDNKN